MNIQENTFAEACYNTNSIEELQTALTHKSDETDMKVWGLSEREYFESIKLALKKLREEE